MARYHHLGHMFREIADAMRKTKGNYEEIRSTHRRKDDSQ